MEQKLLDWPEKEKHRENQAGGEDPRNIEAETNGHPDCRHHPDRSGSGEAVDLVALPQDGARAEEAHSGHDLRGDPGRVGGTAKGFEPKPRKQARADSDKSEGFDSRGVAVKLALETDCDREQSRDQQPEGEIDVA